ncbi:50S ribosomal protein L1 [Blattabacterium cuenoti]|uniref:50S ribosomal protein L1 n=1 Tax=Blattabacterium cuenoti TaxID=1653831 RepID=UPI00163D0398|nr:50S ribosomal protein L1 [Blattabacterium cuenoti]
MLKKLTRNRKRIIDKISRKKYFLLDEAIVLMKEINFVKFDASVDITVRLGIDIRLPNQMVKGTVLLPHGIGKNVRILALVPRDKELEVKEAGADHVGLDYIEKIKSGWADIDIIVATPSVMNKLSSIGKILGPKGLMPNPKMDTVSMDPVKSIKEIKFGRISFKADRYGIVHASIGRISFSKEHLFDNIKEFMAIIIRNKPSSSKGVYIKNIYLSTTMSHSIPLELKSFVKT